MATTDWTRRNFIKAAGAAGGAWLMSSASAGHEAIASPGNAAFTSSGNGAAASSGNGAATSVAPPAVAADDMLRGVSDIHVHAAPDTKPRSINELAFAREARAAGYRAVMFKSNDWSCHDRAYLVRQALPDFECFGSLIMNRAHGGKVNIYAAEMAVKTTGNYCRCIWMPTLDAAYQHSYEKRPGQGIAVLDEQGRVLPEVVRVMEICAEADIMLASGHASPAESLILAAKAKEVGLAKFVITHANSYIWKMTHGEVKRAIDLGAYIEYSYITNLWGPGTGLPHMERLSNEEFVAYARIAPERSFITTDLGQVDMPHPLEGMRLCISELLRAGMPQKDVDLLIRINPAKLIGLAV